MSYTSLYWRKNAPPQPMSLRKYPLNKLHVTYGGIVGGGFKMLISLSA